MRLNNNLRGVQETGEEGEKMNIWQISPFRSGFENDVGLWKKNVENSLIGIGWNELGDLRKYKTKDSIKEALKEKYNYSDTDRHWDIDSCWHFCNDIKEGDIVVAKKGSSTALFGIGIVKNQYTFIDKPTDEDLNNHIINVKWIITFDDAKSLLLFKNFVQWTVHELKLDMYNEIKKALIKEDAEISKKFKEIDDIKIGKNDISEKVSRAIIANITWNDSGWTYPEIHPEAGHKFAQDKSGHECLNFIFNKTIDTGNKVHGYFQTHKSPKNFSGLIFFYSYDFRNKKGKIVGVYGSAKITDTKSHSGFIGFEKNTLLTNIVANKSISLRFPKYLDAEKYFSGERKAPGQVGFSYISDENALVILENEIQECKLMNENNSVDQLVKIYEYFSGKRIELNEFMIREAEENITDITNRPFNPFDDNKKFTLAQRRARNAVFSNKILTAYNGMCAVCGAKWEVDNSFEAQAAHIIPKGKNGSDDLRNGIALCRFHHWAFDKGLFTINQQYLVKVFSSIRNYSDSWNLFMEINNKLINLPKINEPHKEALKWHEENVFKKLSDKNER